MNGGAAEDEPSPAGGLRVLVVSTSPMVWGAERSLLGLAPLLQERGIALTLASPPGQLCEAWSGLDLPHVEFTVPSRLGLRAADDGRPGPRALGSELATTARSARRLARLARGADVLHSNSLWAHLDCALAGRIARRPVVLELHDLVRPGLGRVVLRAAIRLASSTMAVSQAVAETVGADHGRLRVVPQAVDPVRFQPGPPEASWRVRLSSRPDEPIVGVVGRVDPEKGIRTVVRAMSMLVGPAGRSHLAVVGSAALDDGTYESELRAEAALLLGDRSRFVGSVDDVPAVLRSLDVLVNASASEPFGLSVLEAQACGVPVIGTDAGGIPEFVRDGETGVLVAPGRPDALAEALTSVLGAPELRRDLAAAARNGVVARHTLAARAETVAGVYRAGPIWPEAGGGPVRTLMVTKFLPLPDDNGGRQRSLAIARRLAELGELVLCGYDDGRTDRSGLADLGIEVRAVPRRATPGRVVRGIAATRSVSAGRFWSADMVKTVRRAAEERAIDLLQVEYQQMVPFVLDVPAKRSVLDLHNVESALVDSYARGRRGLPAAALRTEAAALRRMERRTVGVFDHVVVVSEQERARLTAGARSVLVCPNGREPSVVLPDAPDATVAFVATMGWAPNVDAALWLGREIWPAVLAQVPDAHLLLVGKDPAPAVRVLAGETIEVTGTVADVTPYLARSRVVVAPLRAGGGTRLKIMEALDVGRPVVATSVGCEGMDDLVGRGVVVADTSAALADAIASLLVDPDRASALGRAGHEAVASDHTWDAALAPLLEAVRPQ